MGHPTPGPLWAGVPLRRPLAAHTRTPLTRQNLMREAVAHYLAAEFCARRRTITIVAQTVS
jgi:hypothetical protein